MSPFRRLQWEHGWLLSQRTLRFAHGTQFTGFLPDCILVLEPQSSSIDCESGSLVVGYWI